MTPNINCCQLTAESKLSTADYEQLARLIYRTDPYIYPAIFENESDAVIVLGQLLREHSDAMFSLCNCFAAVWESPPTDSKIAGLILWKKGPLFWDDAPLKVQAQKHGIPLSPHFDSVKTDYFASYAKASPNLISLINVCVDSSAQGHGIGSAMMEQFICTHAQEEMELVVLADNHAAVHLYSQRAQFQITDTIQGFACDQRTLPCYVMYRKGIGPHLSR